ncbi:MAG: TVP38/TMEM64 family protein [Selenomonadaceae bacterium]|nr:TVP38/TMEM64 family protein [Selenomonadaceae bacterium]
MIQYIGSYLNRGPSMKKVKLIAFLLILLLLILIHTLEPNFFPYLWRMLLNGDILETAHYIESFGAWAIAFSFFLTLFVNALGFPPAIIFSTANTIIFGVIPGIVLSCVAETVGVTISFILLRFFFRESAEKIIRTSKTLTNIDKYSGEKGFIFMLIARMVPYIPSILLNAVGALSALSLKSYIIASFIGKFPSTGIEAIIGHDAILREEDPTRIIVTVVFAILLIVLAWLYQKRETKKTQSL